MLLAHITTAKLVDGTPLYRQELQFARLGMPHGRSTMVRWMIQRSDVHMVPISNLLRIAEATPGLKLSRDRVVSSEAPAPLIFEQFVKNSMRASLGRELLRPLLPDSYAGI